MQNAALVGMMEPLETRLLSERPPAAGRPYSPRLRGRLASRARRFVRQAAAFDQLHGEEVLPSCSPTS